MVGKFKSCPQTILAIVSLLFGNFESTRYWNKTKSHIHSYISILPTNAFFWSIFDYLTNLYILLYRLCALFISLVTFRAPDI